MKTPRAIFLFNNFGRLLLPFCFFFCWNNSAATPLSTDISLSYANSALQKAIVPDLNTQLPNEIPLSSEWKLVSIASNHRVWEQVLPVQIKSLFFNSPPAGMELFQRKSSKKIPFLSIGQKRLGSIGWEFSKKSIRIYLPRRAKPPQKNDFILKYPQAIERERSLRSLTSQKDVFRTMQEGSKSQHGLYLPAPSYVEFSLSLPSNAVLTADIKLLSPQVRFNVEQSLGSTLSLYIKEKDQKHLLNTWDIQEGHSLPIRVDLSAWELQKVQLILESKPLGASSLNYLFMGDPTIYTPQADPKRIIVLFIDTLRQDALSLYGYVCPSQIIQ